MNDNVCTLNGISQFIHLAQNGTRLMNNKREAEMDDNAGIDSEI
jgi:hypothetical protein